MLFTQPSVDGRMLDDIVGPGFLVLARSRAALGASGDWWRDTLDAHVAILSDLNSPELAQWLDRRGADVVVVRPDRYVLGVSDNLDTITGSIRWQLEAAPLQDA